MSSVKLNNLNSSFKVDDKHGHTTLFISSLVIISPQQDTVLPPLHLQVIDQNELVLFSELISSLVEEANQAITLNQQFAIYNYLKVEVITAEPEIEYEVEIYFSFMQNSKD